MIPLPECPARGLVRWKASDCFCRHPQIGGGGVVPLSQCSTCPMAGKPLPPPAPRVGNVVAAHLQRWHRYTPPPECPCKAIQARMNALGPEGCLKRQDELAGLIVANLNATERVERLLPGWVKSGYFRWLIQRASKTCQIGR